MWARKHLAVFLVLASLTISATAVVLVVRPPPSTGLLPFLSYADLTSYVNGVRSNSGATATGGGLFAGPAAPIASPVRGSPTSSPAYSGTNVQVAGVDELDLVKTDGTYLYTASGTEVDILLAYPAADLHVASRIPLENLTRPIMGGNVTSTVGLFLSGSHLLAVADASSYSSAGYIGGGAPTLFAPIPITGTPSLMAASQWTVAFLFDVSDPVHPVLQHAVAISGIASTGRMVGSTVYLVSNDWIWEAANNVVPPQTCVDRRCRDLTPGEIYHDPQSTDAWDYTNLLAVDLGTGEAKPMSIVTGGSSILYMSPSALYLAFYKWMIPSAGLAATVRPIGVGGGWTTIYKLEASGLDISAVASADVSGTILNQYSLDEWNGTLRVATTVRDFSGNMSSEYSNVYVFNASLGLLGSVTKLALGESIFAVRFLGDRAYVVTFHKIDPLFVIDLSDPTAPKVSGFLEMPGFSQYLYPLDAGHLVGVGKDALPAEGAWSWYQGLKLSLYDVTNGSDPRETSNVSIGDRGSQSEVLSDPHAFLYIPDRQLLVLPVDLAIIDPSQYPDGVPTWAWGNIVWQGAYVYRVNESAGFTYVGRIAHGNGTVDATYRWYDAPAQIRRSLYIGDVLYTVSATEVLASSLADLSEIAHVVYASPPVCPYCGPIVFG